ncbi:golgin subfamily A member 2 [Sitophilus oryzae]|uniref:Golgin subfamily A member 2 n=1 Tax=Sitophilus oryzae TaxID=7048 RepID=A0A6J2Y460_SITOR|nr:golgin subfamily A member 2 [Sitophilus oryzae]
MADATTDKKLKLANTRKRFKELQELKKRRNEGHNQKDIADSSNANSHESSYRNTPIEVQESSVHNESSKVDEGYLIPIESTVSNILEETRNGNVPSDNLIFNQDETLVATANYFENNSYGPQATFFDNIAAQNTSNPLEQNPSLLTYFSTRNEDNSDQPNSENIGKARYFDSSRNSLVLDTAVGQDNHPQGYELFPNNVEKPAENTNDALCLDDPEIKQNEIQEFVSKSAENLAIAPEPVVEFYQKNLDNIFIPNKTEKLVSYRDSITPIDKNADINEISQEIDKSTALTKKEIQHSNVESLKQLSNQLTEMIDHNYNYSSTSSITDLEKRNIELAALLEKEKNKSEQLTLANKQLQDRIQDIGSELKQNQSETNLQNAQEISHLNSELQAHLQTIGLLVAEKTELSSNLRQYELNHKQKIEECEELQGRLKASRMRVIELERELSNLKEEKNRTDTAEQHYNLTLENFKQEFKLLKQQKDELAQDLLEVREKLRMTSEKNIELQQETKELAGKLSLADIKIQQLSFGGVSGVDNQVEILTNEKFALESQVTQLNQTLKSIIKERDESSAQYQQYAQQLNVQLTNLSSKLEQLQKEKENFVIQEQNRIKHIGELERQLQNIQDEHISYSTNSNSGELKQELEKFKELCVQLQIEKTTAEESYTKVTNEKKLLLGELEAKTDSISQLESMIDQLRGNQPDSVKLLAAMESDKVAASRAIQQNKELKQQLESMQEVFQKMDNDKVELTENLKGQQQTNKELIEKLQKTELSLQSLADAIEIKDKELTHLRESSDEMNRQTLHHEQLEDRLRHYEAHDNSAHILQNELHNAKQIIAQLTNELNRVKSESHVEKNVNGDGIVELEEARKRILELSDEVNRLKLLNGNEVTENFDTNDNIVNKEKAMKYLEEKVKKTMQEIADLSDEKQRLEHIVLQLQSETETIEEYVALYQHQRKVLKQKALEKDQQLKQLACDREQIKTKLDRLNQLITKLVKEKGVIPAELIEHQESMKNHSSNLCESHSKINSEINKITETHKNIEAGDSKVDTTQTADEIILLLSEIKTSNLVQPNETLHRCAWCSGQLITV